MLPRIRKFDSGSEKRKKKKRIEQLVQSQKGALDKFFTKGSTSNSENITDNEGVVATETAVMCDNPVFIDFDMPIKNNDDKIDDEDNNNDDNLDMNENDSVENNEGFDVGGEKIDVENGSHMNNTFDMFDPRNWDSLNSDMIKIGDFEFLVALVIWYEILYRINFVSKQLQSKNMILDVAIDDIKKLVLFFEDYRESGFNDAVNIAREIALELNVDPVFPKKRVIRRKKQFDENQNDTSEVVSQTSEESFRVNYFLFVVDQAIGSLRKRFEQYEEFQNVFGFLFSSSKLHTLDNAELKSCCDDLQVALTSGEQCDIDGNELYMELKLLKDILPSEEEMEAIDILKFLKRKSYFPNAFIAYRILLTIPVTVASAERSFSKLKLLKSYMRSTMLQERLTGLAIIAIEDDLLEKVDYNCLIEEFASRKTTRKNRFSNNL
ncbi:uncharacterized protein LOC141594217 [Silene latifolia]|uniref:uncharacterized protein LOC141594217 n=1 Tax=Silene latifolia TaxID=37657 RepID=UPI003D770877